MKVGDLVRLSAIEEETLKYELGWKPKDTNDWKVGIIIEVCTNHGNSPFYQVLWSPANEVIEESRQSITRFNEDEGR